MSEGKKDKKTKTKPNDTSSKASSAQADKDISKLQEEVEKYKSGWERALADYDNLLKRLDSEREEIKRKAKENIVINILPLYNNLCIAFQHLPEDLSQNEWIKGVEHIKNQFYDILKQLNVEKIKTKDEVFDEKFHEAVFQEETDEYDDGVIIKEITPGYMMDGTVFIPAKVVVAKSKK